ncbi:peptide-methionine (S)-S-oxide reductase [Ectothiorhodospiraceae bacterium BW-2]|nr:peptide-methionine (S)-S-oxide reductase [Ectothiorhodospiraceae bacterium BW-2]
MRVSELATLGGGCFWCLEAPFNELAAVTMAISGYAGGELEDPSYEMVCTGQTGHAEVVQVEFQPELLEYRQLLQLFFELHDPTTLNRQGNDSGTQYRSVIFTHSQEQEQTATEVIAELTQRQLWPNRSIVTHIEPLYQFWPAETYHQQFFRHNPYQGYCRAVIAPKMAQFRRRHAALLKGH